MNEHSIDANDIVNSLLGEIAEQAKQIALLRAHLASALKEPEETPEGVKDK